jgi:hypothetical protein
VYHKKVPKISVIVPNYNHARYLPARLDSIFAQTHEDFELIFLDDASTDNSQSVFAQYSRDPRVRSILSQKNSGTFAQWNQGIRLARGDYIWIAESDDSAHEQLLEVLLTRLDEHPNVGLVSCSSNLIDSSDCTIGRPRFRPYERFCSRWESDFITRGPEEVQRFLFSTNTIVNTSAVLLRRTVLEKIGGADETFRLCGDWDMFVRMLRISDRAHVAQPLNYYRQHERTVRATAMQDGTRVVEGLSIQKSIMKRLEVRPDERRRAARLTAKFWMATLQRSSGLVPIRSHLQVCQELRQIDASIAHILLLHYPVALVRRLARQNSQL